MNLHEKPLIMISIDLTHQTYRLERDIIITETYFPQGVANLALVDDLFLRLPKKSLPLYIRGDDQHPWSVRNCLAWNHAAFCVIHDGKMMIQSSRGTSDHDPMDLMNALPRFLQQLGLDQVDFSSISDNIDVEHVRSMIGWHGYVSYEAGRLFHPNRHRNDEEIVPTIVLVLPSRYLVELDSCWIFMIIEGLEIVEKPLAMNVVFPSLRSSSKNLLMAHDVNYHLSAMKQIQKYLYDGEIYQANFTNQFVVRRPTISPRKMFIDLFKQNEVPCAMYLEFPQFQALSLSPELFMEVRKGVVTTRPIKGTRPRGKTPEEDDQFKAELRQSEKDLAELSMIVDLLRNDLSRSCLPATVSVMEHAIIESFSNVHHLVSTIRGEIPSNDPQSTWRLILRAFPGGSITGCPKLRAMEIIEELETVPRGIYTGIMGRVAVNGDAWFNIAIRTALVNEEVVVFNAGGGIVLDSDPDDEYMEMLHKARHLAEYFGVSFVGHLTWINGELLSSRQVSIPVDAASLQYGIGCFETIRVKNGFPLNLSYHFQRLERGLQALGLPKERVKLPSERDIYRFLKLNLAVDARLKILVTPLISSQDESSQVLVLMTVAPFCPDSDPVSLLLLDEDFCPPQLVRQFGIKSTCRADYIMATKKAQAKGFWDALLQHEGKLLEAGRANILIHVGEQWLTPRNNVVRGTVRERLLEVGVVQEADLTIDSLKNACCVLVCNALHGLLLVTRIEQEETTGYRLVWRMHDDTERARLVQELNMYMNI